MTKFILSALAAFALACACTPEEAQQTVTLTASPETVEFKAAGGNVGVTFTTDTELEFNGYDSWIAITPGVLADNKQKIAIKAGENESETSRETTVNVLGHSQSIVLTVCQAGADTPSGPTLEVSLTQLDFDCKGGTLEFTVTSQQEPTVTVGGSNFSVSVGDRDSDGCCTVSVFAQVNVNDSPRQNQVTVRAGTSALPVKIVQEAFSIETAQADPVSIQDLFETLRMGWNMGNHMDSMSNGVASETVWGNKKCTQATMNAVKAAGFSTVRVPITWLGKIGEGPEYKLDEKWLERVAEIVEYCERAGLVVMINTHHDDSRDTDSAGNLYTWADILGASKNATLQQQIIDQTAQMWYQIATRFADKGDFLIMEPFNEIQDGGWGWGESRNDGGKQYKCLNEWNQAFVRAVRLAGGCNATRWLATVGYAQSPTFTLPNLVIPEDYVSCNRIMVGVHDYDPYDYTLACTYSEWGHTADQAKSGGHKESEITTTLDQLKTTYMDKGYPVFIGEMGNSFRSDARERLFHLYYLEYVAKAAHDWGIPAFVWDNGNTTLGSESHPYIDHGTGAYALGEYSQQACEALTRAMNDESASYTLQSVYDSAPARQ